MRSELLVMRSNILDREAFAAWLREQEPTATVGTGGSKCHCPLARFLSAQDARLPEVGGTLIRYYRYDQRWGSSPRLVVPTPRWAQVFIARVDMAEADVTAAQALAALESIPDEEARYAL